MGNYITYDELIVRYPLIKTWSDKESHVESYMIYYAERMVDAMLAPAYSVPFSAGHATVKDLSLDVCKYKALMDQDAEKAAEIYDVIRDRVDRLISGQEVIVTGSGTIAPSGGATEIWSNTKDYHPTHSMLDDDNYYTQIDSSMLDAMESERS